MPRKRGRKTLLVIDDEKGFCDALADYLQDDDLAVLSAQSGADGLAACSRTRIDVVLLDQKLPDGEGHALAPAILERNDQTKIIFVTAFPSFENAVTAVRTGAHDYLSKPLDLEELKRTVRRMLRTIELERMAQVHVYEQDRERARAVIVGSSGGLAGVEALVASAAKSAAPVLITGETGTGKSLVAKSIHYLSSLAGEPFIDINCSALPETLIEAELFGYEKGAFTGAVGAKKGLFEMADGGTLFLDEIGEMPMHLQTKLLHALESDEVRRIGATTAVKVRVRVIAATNSDIERTVGKTFRQDLFYRLNVIQIHMPPLREHREDIPALCDHLLKSIEWGRSLSISGAEMERLKAYDWPGNVRELRNVLERAALVQHDREYRPSLLLGSPAERSGSAAPSPAAGPENGIITLEESEKRQIAAALDHYQGNIARTAKALGTSLSTLKRRIRQFGLQRSTGSN